MFQPRKPLALDSLPQALLLKRASPPPPSQLFAALVLDTIPPHPFSTPSVSHSLGRVFSKSTRQELLLFQSLINKRLLSDYSPAELGPSLYTKCLSRGIVVMYLNAYLPHQRARTTMCITPGSEPAFHMHEPRTDKAASQL